MPSKAPAAQPGARVMSRNCSFEYSTTGTGSSGNVPRTSPIRVAARSRDAVARVAISASGGPSNDSVNPLPGVTVMRSRSSRSRRQRPSVSVTRAWGEPAAASVSYSRIAAFKSPVR